MEKEREKKKKKKKRPADAKYQIYTAIRALAIDRQPVDVYLLIYIPVDESRRCRSLSQPWLLVECETFRNDSVQFSFERKNPAKHLGTRYLGR